MTAAPRFCSYCGEPESKVGKLSTRGKCIGCALEIQEANIRQINAHAGPFFKHWRRRSVHAFGGQLPDEVS